MRAGVALIIASLRWGVQMKNIIDISVPLYLDMPVWPGSAGIQLMQTSRLDKGDGVNNSKLICDVHIGTHIDAPLHYIVDGKSIEQLKLEDLIGPAVVAYLPEAEIITKNVLEDLSLPEDARRLLLRTRNSSLWETGSHRFQTNYVALTQDAAQWIVDHDICLIGVDYLSVQRYGEDSQTHEILLSAGVIIVEGLNLARVESGMYELICLPLKLVGSEGAPARAVLRKMINGGL